MKWLWLGATSFAVLLIGCRPNYPNCNADADCPGHARGGEFCVANKCQQCRPDVNDCGVGRQCNAGLCVSIPGYCTQNSACPTGLCERNRCVSCVEDKSCPGGTRCTAGQCVADSRKPCKTHDECAETEDCVQGRCTPLGGAGRYAAGAGGCSLEPIYFGYNEFDLSAASASSVDRNAECVKKQNRAVNVLGYTDPRGTPEYNLALSDKRAQAVHRRLLNLGLSPDRVVPVPKGETESTGADESSWERDRRVDMVWR